MLVTGLISITCLDIVIKEIGRMLDEERDAQKHGNDEGRLKHIEDVLARKEQ